MKPKVVVCGSFHKNPEALQLVIEELEQTNCHVLSPLSIRFENRDKTFVRSKEDEGFSDIELERFHLRAIKQADFIWLYNPSGYIGTSATMELGYAHALQKPIFAFESLSEPYLGTFVTKVSSVFMAIKLFSDSYAGIPK